MSTDIRSTEIDPQALLPTRFVECCRRKVKYLTRRRAAEQVAAMVQLRVQNWETLNVYACVVCGGWHVGNWRKGETR